MYFASRQSYFASKSVTRVLRSKIYDKLVSLGGHYGKKLSGAELLQISFPYEDQATLKHFSLGSVDNRVQPAYFGPFPAQFGQKILNSIKEFGNF